MNVPHKNMQSTIDIHHFWCRQIYFATSVVFLRSCPLPLNHLHFSELVCVITIDGPRKLDRPLIKGLSSLTSARGCWKSVVFEKNGRFESREPDFS